MLVSRGLVQVANRIQYSSATGSGSGSSLPLRLILLGLPGSGKGTQGKWIARDYDTNIVSTGDLLRNLQQSNDNPSLTAQIKREMSGGGLVSDKTIIDVFEHAAEDWSNDKGWILDGYPRTVTQAEALCAWLAQRSQSLSSVLYIDVDKEIIWNERIKGRRVHPGSGRVYHSEFNPPQRAGFDDVTGEPLVQREDDTEEVVRARFAAYDKETAPLLDYYRKKNLLFHVHSPTSKIGYSVVRPFLDQLIQQ